MPTDEVVGWLGHLKITADKDNIVPVLQVGVVMEKLRICSRGFLQVSGRANEMSYVGSQLQGVECGPISPFLPPKRPLLAKNRPDS